MIRVGIFFGGRSREREISFAGGRTVYDNLDKAIFEPVPIFVDALGKLTLLNWEYIYKGTIRDFFPGPAVNDGGQAWQVHADSLGKWDDVRYAELQRQIGQPLTFEQLPGLMDMAFLTLHGPFGEDGSIQGMLEWLGIPYTGSGLYASAFGIHKIYQRQAMTALGFPGPDFLVVKRKEFTEAVIQGSSELFARVRQQIGFPCVVKAPHQGSSIGVSVLKNPDLNSFSEALARSFFLERIERSTWVVKTPSERQLWINAFLDVRSGTGLPVSVYGPDLTTVLHRCYWPEELFEILDKTDWSFYWLEPDDAEEEVLVEAFIQGKEFSCIVVESLDGTPLALPPTEIIKSSPVFDYRAKYLPGISRKVTPIDVPEEHLEAIKSACERMYTTFGFQVYARLDGFISAAGQVFLNDPNTTSGMLPSSFFFHQAAEIGLNPSQFLTFILYSSLKSRLVSGKSRYKVDQLLRSFQQLLDMKQSQVLKRTRVAVVMGGYSSERHISMESGRNIFEKLSSSSAYAPIPVFLTGSDAAFSLYRLPIKYMLKDNADDVRKLVQQPGPVHPFINRVIERARPITELFASDAIFSSGMLTLDDLASQVDEVFIALHGRPGEDGSLQARLEEYGMPYNGSGVESSRKTINKYETNALLRKHGIHVASHRMVYKSDWLDSSSALFESIEQDFPYPFIAKPSDDGCSSAVKKIKSRAELGAFCAMMFREEEEKPQGPAEVLQLRPAEEFPQKTGFLIETLIDRAGARHFLEITGGMLTRIDAQGKRVYEVFEPSETLASGEVLSLEEKFLAGEGQNITPARFSPDPAEQARISAEVRKVLERTAEVLDVEGYCRVDAFVRIFEDGNVETLIIEINSLPGMTPATCIFHQAAIHNLKPLEFIDAILDYGKKKSGLLV
jgi:UDP-N-acetylmuramate--alanine ligase